MKLDRARRTMAAFLLCLAATAATTAAAHETILSREPVSIAVKDGQLSEVLRLIAKVGEMNLVLDSSVSGKTITLSLDGVPWDQALDIILTSQGLASDIDGNVLRVAPAAKLITEANQAVQLREAREAAGELRTIAVPLSNTDAASAEAIIRRSLTSRGSTSIDRRTNTIFITDVFPSLSSGSAQVVAVPSFAPTEPAPKMARFVVRLMEAEGGVPRSFTTASGAEGASIVRDARVIDSSEIELSLGATASLLLGDPTDGSAVRLGLTTQLDGGRTVLVVRAAALDLDRGTVGRALESGQEHVMALPGRMGSGPALLLAFNPM